jgi:hypothetical protein
MRAYECIGLSYFYLCDIQKATFYLKRALYGTNESRTNDTRDQATRAYRKEQDGNDAKYPSDYKIDKRGQASKDFYHLAPPPNMPTGSASDKDSSKQRDSDKKVRFYTEKLRNAEGPWLKYDEEKVKELVFGVPQMLEKIESNSKAGLYKLPDKHALNAKIVNLKLQITKLDDALERNLANLAKSSINSRSTPLTIETEIHFQQVEKEELEAKR